MSAYTLTKTRFIEGVWEGVISGESADVPPPEVLVTHLEQSLPGVVVTGSDGPGTWVLRVPVPVTLIGDGVQTFVISDARTGDTLDSFALIAGEALGEDIRAEMALLRAELDLLKRAFRRHCLETS
ncbi:hypothetical protein ROJ8625_00804 [Roseivivax jejudonensis]|uniref:Uncharacterized protein n=1 Tax=Roseivivax jejudonensis TaxID=1529041 RepID=A0A1X6YHB1_9RHOB|nr:hypothetical protein [Roseivivax jejudonensis]SLN21419.1 hypothetical protein ROJ8625_00804 [Roseivivax jejudonensis]